MAAAEDDGVRAFPAALGVNGRRLTIGEAERHRRRMSETAPARQNKALWIKLAIAGGVGAVALGVVLQAWSLQELVGLA